MTEKTERILEAAMVGALLILAAAGVTMAIARAGESQTMSLRAQCDAMTLAAVMVQENGIHCPGAADFGHDEGTLAVCRMARGRTPEQVAALPQCRESAL